jgi:hypothetical protein
MTQIKEMYIGETESLSQSNGELYLDGEFGSIIWNTETLFTDLPHIIRLVYQARAETDKRIKEQIAEITKIVNL